MVTVTCVAAATADAAVPVGANVNCVAASVMEAPSMLPLNVSCTCVVSMAAADVNCTAAQPFAVNALASQIAGSALALKRHMLPLTVKEQPMASLPCPANVVF